MPVYEDEEAEKKPCDELQNMKIKPISNTNKTVIDNLNYLNNNVNIHKEMLYILSPSYINNTVNYDNYVESYYESELNADMLNVSFGANLIDIIMHTHWDINNHLSTFSVLDLYQIYTSIAESNIQNTESFTSILITAHGTKYALKINNANDFVNWGNTFFAGFDLLMPTGVENPFIIAKERLYEIQFGVKLGNSPAKILNNDKAFAKFAKEQNVGLEIFRADNTFSQWTKLSTNAFGGYKEIPCP